MKGIYIIHSPMSFSVFIKGKTLIEVAEAKEIGEFVYQLENIKFKTLIQYLKEMEE